MQQLLALPLIHVVLRSGYVDLHDIHENMHVNISLRFLQNIKFSYYILDLNSLHSALTRFTCKVVFTNDNMFFLVLLVQQYAHRTRNIVHPKAHLVPLGLFRTLQFRREADLHLHSLHELTNQKTSHNEFRLYNKLKSFTFKYFFIFTNPIW